MNTHALRCTRDALLIGDANSPEIRQLLESAKIPASGLNSDLAPLQAITSEIHQRREHGEMVRDLHLIAHGQAGLIRCGDEPIDRRALLANAGDLGCWGLRTIALWSCHVGADADFIALLEELTGAVVYSSQQWLGRRDEQVSLQLEQQRHPLSRFQSHLDVWDGFHAWPSEFELGRRKKRNRNALPFSQGDTFFGLDDDNNVWQVNPTFADLDDIGQPFMKALRLYDPLVGDTKLTRDQGSNGIAFDGEKDNLYFLYLTNKSTATKNGIEAANGATEPDKKPNNMGQGCPFNIVWWNLDSGAEGWDWVEWPEGSSEKNFGSSRDRYAPANAAFYGDSLWYFHDETAYLYQLELDYESDGRPFAKRLTKYEIEGYPTENTIFGDIVIKEEGQNLFLYGSHGKGRFFSLDLNKVMSSDENVFCSENKDEGMCVEVENAYRELSANLELMPDPEDAPVVDKKGLQLTYNNDYSTLWGQTYSSKEKDDSGYFGVYYTVQVESNEDGPQSVSVSDPIYKAPDFNDEIIYGFRDLGGSTDEPAEPLPPDFEVEGTKHCEEDWDWVNAAFEYNITLQNIDIWDRVFEENRLYGPFVADFDFESEIGDYTDYFVESISGKGIVSDGRNDKGEIWFSIDPDLVQVQPSESDPEIKDGTVTIVADIKVPEGSFLAGDEQLELQLILSETGEEKLALSEFDSPEDCFPGSILEIKGLAKCLEVGFSDEKEAAQFSFKISRQDADDMQYYQYQLNAIGVNEGYEFKRAEILAFDADGNEVEQGVTVIVDSDDQKNGLVKVKADVVSFDVDIQMLSDNFEGSEQLDLSLANVYSNGDEFKLVPATEKTGFADLKGEDCVIPLPSAGQVESVEGSAACEIAETGSRKDAVFSFAVSFDPAGDLEQRYDYDFVALGALNQSGYKVESVDFSNGVTAESLTDGGKSGALLVPGGVKDFEVDLVLKSADVLSGDEGLELTVSNEESKASGDAVLDEDDCGPTTGQVKSVEGSAACEIEATGSRKDAVFSFAVSFDPAGDLEQRYVYDFEALGALNQSGYKVESVDFSNGVTAESLTDGGKSGALLVPGGVKDFEVDLVLKSADVLSGDEGLELTVSNEESKASGDAVLDEDDCGPTTGEVTSVTGEAACEGEGLLERNQATFTFDVDLIPSAVDEIYNYRFKGSGFASGKDYSIIDVELIPASEVDVRQKKITDRARGALDVAAGVDDFSITVMVQSDARLTGEETLNLKVSNDVSTATGVASLATHDCDDPSSVVAVDGLGYCELADPDFDRDLEFSFAVTFEPGSPTLYGYELGVENMSLLADYSIQPLAITDMNGDAIDVEVMRDGDLSGTVLVGEGVEKALATFHVLTDGTLSGDEALTLTVGEPEAGGGVAPGTGVIGSVSAADDIGSCEPGVADVEAITYCSFEAGDDGVQADFSYEVILDPDSSGRHSYRYAFTWDGFEADDYSIEVLYSSPDGDVVSRDLDRNRREGVIRVDEGVSEINIDVSVTADAVIDETEALTLTINDKSGPTSAEATAVLSTQGCISQWPDSSLLLLMDNSTSMLGSDPSTRNASANSRLEAQNRIAFYAFEQAAERAGYGFRRKGDASFESFGDASTDAILNTSSGSLAKALGQYELVDNPNDGRQAGDLLVNQITFGYVVDEEETVIRSDGIGNVPVKGSAIAERILLTTTPNTIFGDSINGNATWDERNLPQPEAKDLFRGRGAQASNLYSGTEMLGALDGLHSLLNRRLRDGDIDEDGSTFVVMTTDGRPERRSWWDNRKGKGDGLAIPLPASLGGDSITASGLLYDRAGDWNYVPDDSGVNQWPKTRRRLNNTLNRLADVLFDPSEQLQVEAIGLGDDEGVDYQTIYDNLFTQQTFDNSNSSWSYDFFPSFNLPDFQG